MKTLLIGINSKYIHPAMGVYQIVCNINSEVEFFEFTIKDDKLDIEDKIRNSDFEVIGFSIYIWNVQRVMEIINDLKVFLFDKHVVLGGPEASYNYKTLLENESVNFIIKDEGETSINELISYLDNKIKIEEVSNLYYKDDNIIKFTYSKVCELGNVKHNYELIKDYKNRVCYIESSRGCYFNCSYCLASIDKPVRFFDVNRVKEDIYFLLKQKAKIVKFLDRSFNINQKYMLEILKFINENDNSYTVFQFEIVGDILSKEVISYIKTMRRHMLRFEIGIQTTNEVTTKAILRHQDFNKIGNNIKELRDYVVIHADLIAGLPYEDKESFIKSFNESFLLFPHELQLGFLKELKGTYISITKDIHEYKFSDVAPYEVISNKYITNDELKEVGIVEEGLDRFYNSKWYKRTFNYLFNEEKISSPYHLFKDLVTYISNYGKLSSFQVDKLSKLLYDSLKNKVNNSEKLLYYIKQDYLTKDSIKPYIWWENEIDRKERNFIYQKFVDKYEELNMNMLYKCSKLEKCDGEYFLVTYLPLKEYKLKMMIAPCGFDCIKCPYYSSENSQGICDGCFGKKRFNFCLDCDINKCNEIKFNNERKLCSKCNEFPCEKLNKISFESMNNLKNYRKMV